MAIWDFLKAHYVSLDSSQMSFFSNDKVPLSFPTARRLVGHVINLPYATESRKCNLPLILEFLDDFFHNVLPTNEFRVSLKR